MKATVVTEGILSIDAVFQTMFLNLDQGCFILQNLNTTKGDSFAL